MTETTLERFGVGPWAGEPDDDRWIDEATGYPCAAIRHPRMGHFCGYVGVPDGHAMHGRDYSTVHDFADREKDDFEELTWAEDHPGGKEPDSRATWWFGFDFAHIGDVLPYDLQRGHLSESYASYKTLDYTRAAAAKVAAVLVALASRDSRRTETES